ncbi:hypothetical protein Sme01_57080 [Sphaerisporangium melleum]|uniref:Uncharacterized protein n=1 Tax=Sphaerisporangium melleum TaxID=321316 RepID=A0A917R8B8_9ACTN|nr:hypothetical protein GCM10007964_40960 [Sphaerisporangium melleum]GII73232.1 hypothetical protein Sme01_57080 [Sphaerisporangium melleum]
MAAALITLAGCAGGSGGAAGASPTAAAISDAEMLRIGKQLAQCFRDNGVPSLPDPIVKDGRLRLPDGKEDEIEAQYSEQVREQAEEACRGIMDKLPQSALRGGGDEPVGGRPGPGDVDALRAYAKCVREHGIPEWPDPKPDGTFPLRGTALQGERGSQRMTEAAQACRQHWAGGLVIS